MAKIIYKNLIYFINFIYKNVPYKLKIRRAKRNRILNIVQCKEAEV